MSNGCAIQRCCPWKLAQLISVSSNSNNEAYCILVADFLNEERIQCATLERVES